MHIRSFIMVVTVLMVSSACSSARSGLEDGGSEWATDGSTPDAGPCPPEGCDTDAGQVDSGMPDVDAGMPGEDAGLVDTGLPVEDAGTDSGMIVMPDAGTDAGPPPCPSGVYSSVTGRCYQYLGSDVGITHPDPADACATIGMEPAWWATTAEQAVVETTGLVPPSAGVATDLGCPNYWVSPCSHGAYTWTHHPEVTPPAVDWTAGTPTSGTGAGLHSDGMHAISSPRAGGGYLCQSL
jgi:hypothetical protein